MRKRNAMRNRYKPLYDISKILEEYLMDLNANGYHDFSKRSPSFIQPRDFSQMVSLIVAKYTTIRKVLLNSELYVYRIAFQEQYENEELFPHSANPQIAKQTLAKHVYLICSMDHPVTREWYETISKNEAYDIVKKMVSDMVSLYKEISDILETSIL